MPVYKKKSKKLLGSAPRRTTKVKKSAKVCLPKSDPQKSNNNRGLKIIKGRKLEQRRKLKFGAMFFAVLISLILILELSLPISIGDSLENYFAKIGSGGYPIEIYGTDLFDVKTANGYYYTLSDTAFSAYNSSGKEIYSYSHGFENPVIKKSATRAILFEQGGQFAAVYNLLEEKSNIKTKNEIITANIARNGAYAIATNSEQYAATVSVYSENDELLYEWYSAEDLVNNIALSPSGKKLAVSTVNAKGGQFVSKILVFEFDSATPVFSETYDNTVFYSLETAHNSGFWCVSKNMVEFIKWSKFSNKKYETDYSISHFKADLGGGIAVFSRQNDHADSKIVLFSKSGKKKKEFGFKGNISDISVANGHIYCISDNTAYILDKNGEILKTAQCGFGAEKFYVTGNYSIAVINDNTIAKIELK